MGKVTRIRNLHFLDDKLIVHHISPFPPLSAVRAAYVFFIFKISK